MIVKDCDTGWRKLAEQELELLLGCRLTPRHREQIGKELGMMRSGNSNERNTAIYLNAQFRDKKNWLLLHDLRIEDEGDVAQIDHLLINRLLDFFVIDSKGYGGRKVIITEADGFYTEENGKRERFASPISQNERHIIILTRVLKKHQLVPNKLFSPDFLNYILFNPATEIVKPEKPSVDVQRVMHADLFYKELEKIKNQNAFTNFFNNIKKVSSVIGRQELRRIGEGLLQLHQPKVKPDYRKRFGIQDDEITPKTTPEYQESKYYCDKCKQAISREEAKYCFNNSARFGGRAYCRQHQKDFRSHRTT